jgi:hypothetical protein
MRDTLTSLGLAYHHTLPADDRWNYAMHVFVGAELRLVYHAGDPARREALIDSTILQDSQETQIALQIALATIVRNYGGQVFDPHELQRGAVL